MSISKFYRVDLNHLSKRCCRICLRPSDKPKGQICRTCSAVIRATQSARVCLPIPFVHVVLAIRRNTDMSTSNFIDAVFVTLDELDARRWYPVGPPFTGSKELY